MRPISITTLAFPAAAPAALAASQSLAAAGNLTLTAAAASISPPRRVTITSAGNDSARTITITGVSAGGYITQSETLSAGNAAAVTSALTYSSVTSIAFNGATASTVTAGTTQSGASQWIPMDIYNPNQVTTISANVTGTINYSIEYTNEDPFSLVRPLLAVAHPVAALTSATASQTATTTTLMRAVRYVVNSGSGTLGLTIVQQSTL